MIGDLIGEWIKGILIDGIMGNLSGLFNTVNGGFRREPLCNENHFDKF